MALSKEKSYITIDSQGIILAKRGGSMQLLLIKQVLADYELSQFPIDNSSAIQISKSLVHYSRTKYKDTYHHFIYGLVREETLSLDHVSMEERLT